MKNSMMAVIILLLAGCAAKPETVASDQKSKQPSAQQSEQQQPTLAQRIYYFQHKLISNWLFESNGAFFTDLQNNNFEPLTSAAEKLITPEYAQQMVITLIPGRDAAVINFPSPSAPPECYFALILKTKDGFAYYTYEKTLAIGNEGYVGVVGSWNKEGTHGNHGPRNYQTASAFIDDMLGLP